MVKIIEGRIHSAKKIVIYGLEGIGKSTLASLCPDPLFIDTEGSTTHMDVKRFEAPTSWQMLLDQVQYVINNPAVCKTLVIDTADWAEQLEINELCRKNGWASIETPGYGKGYQYSAEEFGRLLNKLTEVVNKGVNVVITAHASLRKVELPEELRNVRKGDDLRFNMMRVEIALQRFDHCALQDADPLTVHRSGFRCEP